MHACRASDYVSCVETVLNVALRGPFPNFTLVLPACLQGTQDCMIGVCSSAGCQWQNALEIFYMMPRLGLFADKITYSSVISALSKGKMWEKAMQVSAIFKNCIVTPTALYLESVWNICNHDVLRLT